MVKKAKPFYKTSIAYDVKEEWMMKEYGSWEDHQCVETGHIYPLLRSMPNDKIVCMTSDEAAMVQQSAYHQTSWDSDEKVVIRLKKKAGKIASDIHQLMQKEKDAYWDSCKDDPKYPDFPPDGYFNQHDPEEDAAQRNGSHY